MKYKIGKSKIDGAGKGLIVKKPFRAGEMIGLAHVDDQPVTSIGKFHNHSEEPTAGSIKIDNRRYIVAMRDLEPGDEITTDYRQQPELEQPEDFKKGGSTGLPKMPKPSKKGVLGKGYSRSLEATNKFFTENRLFEKPKSRKNKVFDPNANYQEGGSLPKAEYGMPLGTGMSQNYQGRKKFIHQDGGAPIPKGYQAALAQFVNPEVIETPYNTAYNSYTGTIGQDSSDPNQTQDWWMEHEKLHHLQNSAGASHSAGPAGLKANPFVDSEQSLNSNDRRKTELDSQINQMIKTDPNLQFIPREKLAQSTYDEDMQEPGFVGAEDLMYADPSTVEGEARAYEQHIRQGGKSVFPQKQNGGAPYNTDYDSIQEEADAANKSMMKARLAYADMHGNPAAKRMIVAPDQPYQFEEGDTGTHFMASMGDYAVPQIQEENGSLMLGDYGPDSNEAIRFNDENDAQYFAENYKSVSPAFIEAKLTPEEIEQYRRGGWVVEEY